MRRTLALLAVLALGLAGCGGDDDDAGDHAAPLEPGPIATDVCLGERGFSLRPAADGVSAVAPAGAEFTVTFFDTEADAAEAADRAGEDGTAVANAVVTATEGELTDEELATVGECVRGDGGD